MMDDLTINYLWKVTISSLFQNDHRVENVFEDYHANKEEACHAALRQGAIDHGGTTIATIVKVEKTDSGLTVHALHNCTT